MINGVNWHAAWAFQKDPAVRKDILDDMSAAGLTSVRIDFAWATLEPTKGAFSWGQLDTYINEAAAHNMSVLVMLYWPPAWASSTGSSAKSAPPKTPADFGNLLGQVGKRYGSKLAGVEMWNEPDISTFWSGTRQQFFDLLAGAYPVAKGLAPNTTFVAGSPTYIGLASNWFKDAYNTAKFRPGQSYDAVAIHPYMSPSDLPPDAPKSNWSVRGIADLQALRSAKGDTSPLWATEWGWSTHTQPEGTANYWRGVSEGKQADYTTLQIKMLPDYGVTHSYIYTECEMAQTPDNGGANTHERFFGLQRIDYSDKPVVAALTELLNKPKPPDPVPPESDLEERVAFLEGEVEDQAGDILKLQADGKALKEQVDALQKQVTDMAGHLSAAGSTS